MHLPLYLLNLQPVSLVLIDRIIGTKGVFGGIGLQIYCQVMVYQMFYFVGSVRNGVTAAWNKLLVSWKKSVLTIFHNGIGISRTEAGRPMGKEHKNRKWPTSNCKTIAVIWIASIHQVYPIIFSSFRGSEECCSR